MIISSPKIQLGIICEIWRCCRVPLGLARRHITPLTGEGRSWRGRVLFEAQQLITDEISCPLHLLQSLARRLPHRIPIGSQRPAEERTE